MFFFSKTRPNFKAETTSTDDVVETPGQLHNRLDALF